MRRARLHFVALSRTGARTRRPAPLVPDDNRNPGRTTDTSRLGCRSGGLGPPVTVGSGSADPFNTARLPRPVPSLARPVSCALSGQRRLRDRQVGCGHGRQPGDDGQAVPAPRSGLPLPRAAEGPGMRPGSPRRDRRVLPGLRCGGTAGSLRREHGELSAVGSSSTTRRPSECLDVLRPRRSPFGTGGGGTAPWLDFRHPRLVIAASLAKGFGVPLAVVAGARRLIERYERSSETRTHCSPVAAPALHAAENAIAFNHHAGDRARASLSQLVSRLRRKLLATALEPAGGLFPALSIAGTNGLSSEELHRCLQRMEIQTVLQRQRVSGEPRLGVLITALHGNRDIDRLAEALLGLLEGLPEHQTNIRKRGERDGLRSGIRI